MALAIVASDRSNTASRPCHGVSRTENVQSLLVIPAGIRPFPSGRGPARCGAGRREGRTPGRRARLASPRRLPHQEPRCQSCPAISASSSSSSATTGSPASSPGASGDCCCDLFEALAVLPVNPLDGQLEGLQRRRHVRTRELLQCVGCGVLLRASAVDRHRDARLQRGGCDRDLHAIAVDG